MSPFTTGRPDRVESLREPAIPATPPQRPAAPAPETLDSVAKAICQDADRDTFAYLLRSDTQQHGE